jgi:hypothetical protein
MMTTRLATTSLRFNIFDSLEGDGGLIGYNTSKLPNGSRAFVNDNNTLYRLEFESELEPDGTLVVAPGAGPGLWVATMNDQEAIFDAQAYLDGTIDSGVQFNEVWMALGNGNYAIDQVGEELFAIDDDTGEVTYNGLTANYFIVLTGTFTNAQLEGQSGVEFALSSDATGVLLGTSSNTTRSNLASVVEADRLVDIQCWAYAQVSTGDTFQAAIRTSQGAIVETQKFTMSFLRAP